MVQLDQVFKKYHSGRGYIHALSAVSLDIKAGQVVMAIGKSGSGKTTLLNCIGGLERPDKGCVRLMGEDIYALSHRKLSLFQRRHIGFVFQRGNLLSYLSVYDNIAFPLILNKVAARQKDRRVNALLEKIGLPGAGSALPAELSGGEIQRVSVARAVAHQPRFLLADEPTASLDTATGQDLLRLMMALSKEKKCTLIIATHDTDFARWADQVVYIKDGSISKEESCKNVN